jgi:hypothetical protein
MSQADRPSTYRVVKLAPGCDLTASSTKAGSLTSRIGTVSPA